MVANGTWSGRRQTKLSWFGKATSLWAHEVPGCGLLGDLYDLFFANDKASICQVSTGSGGSKISLSLSSAHVPHSIAHDEQTFCGSDARDDCYAPTNHDSIISDFVATWSLRLVAKRGPSRASSAERIASCSATDVSHSRFDILGRYRARRHPHHRARSAPNAASPAVPALIGSGPTISAVPPGVAGSTSITFEARLRAPCVTSIGLFGYAFENSLDARYYILIDFYILV